MLKASTAVGRLLVCETCTGPIGDQLILGGVAREAHSTTISLYAGKRAVRIALSSLETCPNEKTEDVHDLPSNTILGRTHLGCPYSHPVILGAFKMV